MKWDPEIEFAQKIIDEGVPVILTNTVVDKWGIRKKWTPQYLASKIKHKINVTVPAKSSTPQNVLPLYRGEQPLGGLPYLGFRPPTSKKAMTMKEFWKMIENGTQAVYSSANIETYPELTEDLPSFDWLKVDSLVNALLWMGSKGTSTPTHYDKSVNFYVQLHGKKRFILSEPASHQHLHLYPSLHPQRLQTQLNLAKPINSTKFPHFSSIPAVEGLLEAGDVLYIPPYWFHTVITEEPGIGINVWSNSVGMKVEEQLKAVPIPISKAWDHGTIVLGLKTYFNEIIKQVFPDSPKLIHEMVELQFKPLFLDSKIPEKYQIDCSLSEHPHLQTQIVLTQKIEDATNILKPILNQIEDVHIKQMEIFGFMEKIISICIGPNLIYPFLASCYS